MDAIPRPNEDITRANAEGPVRGALGRRVAVVLADTALRLLVLRPAVFRAAGRALLPAVEVRDPVDREPADREVVDRDAAGLLSDAERDVDVPRVLAPGAATEEEPSVLLAAVGRARPVADALARGRAGVLLFPTIVSP